jgi:hypothetical protein
MERYWGISNVILLIRSNTRARLPLKIAIYVRKYYPQADPGIVKIHKFIQVLKKVRGEMGPYP